MPTDINSGLGPEKNLTSQTILSIDTVFLTLCEALGPKEANMLRLVCKEFDENFRKISLQMFSDPFVFAYTEALLNNVNRKSGRWDYYPIVGGKKPARFSSPGLILKTLGGSALSLAPALLIVLSWVLWAKVDALDDYLWLPVLVSIVCYVPAPLALLPPLLCTELVFTLSAIENLDKAQKNLVECLQRLMPLLKETQQRLEKQRFTFVLENDAKEASKALLDLINILKNYEHLLTFGQPPIEATTPDENTLLLASPATQEENLGEKFPKIRTRSQLQQLQESGKEFKDSAKVFQSVFSSLNFFEKKPEPEKTTGQGYIPGPLPMY